MIPISNTEVELAQRRIDEAGRLQRRHPGGRRRCNHPVPAIDRFPRPGSPLMAAAVSLVAHFEINGRNMARPERFELPTFWFVARRSIQLS